MTQPLTRNPLQSSTIDMVASRLCRLAWRTPRQVEASLPFNLGRSTVRLALRQLARDGRAEAKGDINQRFYRASLFGGASPGPSPAASSMAEGAPVGGGTG